MNSQKLKLKIEQKSLPADYFNMNNTNENPKRFILLKSQRVKTCSKVSGKLKEANKKQNSLSLLKDFEQIVSR